MEVLLEVLIVVCDVLPVISSFSLTHLKLLLQQFPVWNLDKSKRIKSHWNSHSWGEYNSWCKSTPQKMSLYSVYLPHVRTSQSVFLNSLVLGILGRTFLYVFAFKHESDFKLESHWGGHSVKKVFPVGVPRVFYCCIYVTLLAF